MARETWRAIRENKNFTIRMYRRGSLALFVSLILNLIMILLSFLMFLNEGLPEFYATDGIRLPILLKPLEQPNMTSTYLLPPDPISEDDNKLIPE